MALFCPDAVQQYSQGPAVTQAVRNNPPETQLYKFGNIDRPVAVFNMPIVNGSCEREALCRIHTTWAMTIALLQFSTCPSRMAAASGRTAVAAPTLRAEQRIAKSRCLPGGVAMLPSGGRPRQAGLVNGGPRKHKGEAGVQQLLELVEIHNHVHVCVCLHAFFRLCMAPTPGLLLLR